MVAANLGMRCYIATSVTNLKSQYVIILLKFPPTYKIWNYRIECVCNERYPVEKRTVTSVPAKIEQHRRIGYNSGIITNHT